MRIRLPGPVVAAALVTLLHAGLVGQSGCIRFGPFATTGTLPANLVPTGILHEVSGIEASRLNPDVLWAHDDGGRINQLVAITTKGQLVQQYQVGNVPNGDWEDIAIGPGPVKGRDYIYLADIGNNDLKFSTFSLIRFPEPVTPATPGPLIVVQDIEVFAFRYPAQVHDAETLLIDPVDGRPYILTKERKPSRIAYLYSYPLPLDASNIKTLKLERSFAHAAPRFSGGDVSSDGRWVLVRNSNDMFVYLRGDASQAFANAFGNLACTVDASNQGNPEALTMAPDGTGVFVTSELAGSPIWTSKGTLPQGSVAMAAWWNFGSESKSWLWGSAGLTLNTFPALGRQVAATLWNARPTAQAAIGFSTAAVPDGVIRFAGGWAHVVPALVVLVKVAKDGTAEVPLGVPQSTSLLGARIHAQAAVEDVASPFGLTLTRGLTVQVGR